MRIDQATLESFPDFEEVFQSDTLKEVYFFDYRKRHKYPGFQPSHVALWNQYIECHPREFSAVAYNVRVGEGASDYDLGDEKLNKMRDDLLRCRIDVLGYNPGHISIIEIKPTLLPVHVSQVITYSILLRQLLSSHCKFLHKFIYRRARPDVYVLAESLKIELTCLPDKPQNPSIFE